MEKIDFRKMDALRIEIREIGKIMGGINPKLSVYQTYKAKQDKLLKEMEIETLKKKLK